MSENIGTKIMKMRKEMKISAESISQAAGIDLEQLNLIENGAITPPISTLIKISKVLGIRLGTIMDGTEESEPVVTTEVEVKINKANNIDNNHDNLNFISLAQQKKDRNMEPLIISVDYKSDGDKGSSHEGEEFIYVIEGEIEIRYGNKTFRLVHGDSIYYDSIVPHVVSTMQPNTKAKLIAVTYTPC